MNEQEWQCDLCGLTYDTEAQVLECAWLDEAYGPCADPHPHSRPGMAAAA
jgi:hypothetical protein